MSVEPRRFFLGPILVLFFVSPLIAEFLLGDFSIKMLPIVLFLAPLYGGGALLIRELARRAGRGWPTIFVLGMAYAIVEEAFADQSLFNPNYLKLNLGLLRPAYIPALGIGAWWTLWMLMVHAIWSIATPIALIEACVPDRARSPWLGRIGMAIVAPIYLLGLVAATVGNYKMNHYMASKAQFMWSGVIVVLLIVVAFAVRQSPQQSVADKSAPPAWLLGGISLAFASAAMVVPMNWGWGAVAALLGLVFGMIAIVFVWERKGPLLIVHQLALSAGAALAYGWHAFMAKPVMGSADLWFRVGNGIFLAATVGLIAFAGDRCSTKQSSGAAQGDD